MITHILFDWGNTVMTDFPEKEGKMCDWDHVEMTPNIDAALAFLSQKYQCCIATNAQLSDKEDIIRALQRVGLDTFFKGIFCFKAIGHEKPSDKYFNSIFESLHVDPSRIIMVGDDLEKDIHPCLTPGMTPVLYNTAHQEYSGFQITDMIDLPDLIETIARG